MKILIQLSLLLMILALSPITSFAQVTGDYRSAGSGNWDALSTWERYDGSVPTWVTLTTEGWPGQFTGTQAVTIKAGDNVAIPVSLVTTTLGTVTIDGSLTLSDDAIFTLSTSDLRITSAIGKIDFGQKSELKLPANATIYIEVGGLIGKCDDNVKIYIGSDLYTCKGNGGSPKGNFPDLYTPTLTSTTPASRCGTGTVNLNATSSPGSDINWFTTPTGGGSLWSGNIFPSPALSATTTYYAQAINQITGFKSEPRVAVVATVFSATPATPGTITGATTVCQNTSGLTYSVSPIAEATSYNWTLPTGWSITSGGTTNSITVSPGTTAQSGTIAVSATSTCGTSDQSSLAVTVEPAVSIMLIDSNPAICLNTGTAGVTYSGTTGNPTNYSVIFDASAIAAAFINQNDLSIPGVGPLTVTIPNGGASILSGVYTGFLTVNTNTCTSEVHPISISVNGNRASEVSLSGGLSPICNNTSPGSLTATTAGSSTSDTYLWYKDNLPTGETSKNYDPGNLTATTTFYCEITSGSCGTVRTPDKTITVTPLSVPAITGTSLFCIGSPLSWTGTPIGGTWSSDNPAVATIFASGLITPLTAGTSLITYSVTTGSCTEIDTKTITVSPSPTLTAVSQAATVCAGSAATINLTGLLPNSTSTISYSINGVDQTSATGVAADGAGVASFTSASLTEANNGQPLLIKDITTTIPTSNCSYTFNQPVNLSVNPTTLGGTITAVQPICYGTSPADLTLSGNIGAVIRWESATDLAFTTPITILETSTTLLGTKIGNLTSNTYFRAVVQSGTCPADNSAPVLISVNPAPTLTAASQATPVCAGSSATINLTGLLPNSTSTISYSINGVDQTPVAGVAADGAGVASFTTANLAEVDNGLPLLITGVTTTSAIPNCPYTFSLPVILSVVPATIGGTVTSDHTICTGNSPSDLTLSGNIGAVIRWESATNLAFTTPNQIAETSTTLSGTTIGNLTANTYFRAVVQSGTCTIAYSNPVLISVNPVPTLTGASQLATVCAGSTATIKLTGLLANSTSTISYSINGVQQTDVTGVVADAASTASFTTVILTAANSGQPLLITGVTTTSAIPNCPYTFSLPVTLSVNSTTVGGTITAVPSICFGTSPADLTLSGNTGAVIRWESATDLAFATPISISETSTTLLGTTIGNLTSNTYYRAVVQSGTCPIDNSAPVLISVNPAPTLTGASQAAPVCAGSAATINLTGLLANSTSTISYLINGVPQTDVTGVVADAAGTANFTTVILTAANNGQTLLIKDITTTSTTPNCTNTFNLPVIISVDQVSIGGSVTSDQTICSGTSPANLTLSGNIGAVIRWERATDATFTTPITIAETTPTLLGTSIGNLNADNYIRAVVKSGSCAAAYSTSVLISVNPAPIASASALAQTICSGTAPSITLSSSLTGTIFNWTVDETDEIGAYPDMGSLIDQPLVATKTNPGKATYTITPTANGCDGPSVNVDITVNPIPTATAPVDQTYCNSILTSPITLSGTPAGVVFDISDGTSIGLADQSGVTSIPQFIPVEASTMITIVPHFGACTGTAVTYNTTVNPTPTVIPSSFAETICSGSAPAISLDETVLGTTFNWTVVQSANVSGASDGTGTTIAQPLTLSGSVPGTVTYRITPTADGCDGTPVDVKVTVNSIPTLSSSLIENACSNEPFSYVPTSNISGVFFNWQRDAVVGIQNIAASGTETVNETLDNITGIAKLVSYEFTVTDNGCTSLPVKVDVTVYPKPSLVSSLAPPAVCSNTLFNYNPLPSIAGTTLNWSRAVVAGISNPAQTGSGDVNEPLINTTATDVVVPYVYTLTNGCSTTVIVNVTIKPTPVLSSAITAPAICNNSVFSYVPASLTPGTTFNWTRTPVSGISNGFNFDSGNVSEALINTTDAPLNVIYSYSLSANGCLKDQDVTVAVNPTPTVDDLADEAFCNGILTPVIPLTGFVSGASFNWMNDKPAIGLAAGGLGDIPSFTATNNTGVPISALIKVTPSANGCDGDSKTFHISVEPSPVANIPGDQTICMGASTSAINFTGIFDHITWTNDHPEIGLAANGSGNIGAFTGTNPGSDPIIAKITVTAHPAISGSGCDGIPFSFLITVNPTPVVDAISNQTFCAGSNNSGFTFSTLTTGGSPTFNWTSSSDIGFGTSGTGTIPSFTAGNAGSSPLTTIVSVTATINGCTGNSTTFAITVNPVPSVIQPADQAFCNNGTTSAVHFTGTATFFSWTNSNNAIGLASTGTGDLPSFTAINMGSVPIVATVTVTPSYTNGGKTCPGTSESFKITVNPSPTGAISGTTSACQGGTEPLITFTGSNGTLPYTFTYKINGGADQSVSTTSGNSVTVSVPTTVTGTFNYTLVKVLAGDGCSQLQSGSATINVVSKPGATISGTTAICQNGATPVVTFTGSGGTAPYIFTYQVNGGAPQTVTTISGNIALLNAPTVAPGVFVYTLISVSSASGCTEPQAGTATITVSSPPNLVINNPAPVCSPSTADLTLPAITSGSTAGLVYTYWTDPLATVSFGSPSTSGNGNYYIKGTDPATGCFAIKPLSVTVVASPNLVITNPAPVCTTVIVNLTNTAVTTGSTSGLSLTYWTDASATASYATPTNAANGVYYIKGTAASGCSVIQPVTVSKYTTTGTPVFTLGATSTICNSSTPTVYSATASNAFSLTYALDATSFAAGNRINASTGKVTFVSTWSGIIKVTATASGCGVATAMHSITVKPAPSVSLVASPSTPVCEGTPVTLTATNSGGSGSGYLTVVNGDPTIGAITYSGGSNKIATTIVTPITAGIHSYTVTTTDGQGCSTTSAPVSVSIKPLPTPTIIADYCSLRPKVQLTVSDSYSSYLWNNGATNQTVQVDIAGKYKVTVTDANGCSGTTTVAVAEELVTNGDFELGAPGYNINPAISTFTTDYGFRTATGSLGGGLFGIGKDARGYYTAGFRGAHDHTSGSGYFMIVDGTVNTKVVWQQIIPVTPNTDYYFSAWGLNIYRTNGLYDPDLRFSVNGTLVGFNVVLNQFTSSDNNPWLSRFWGQWNSGSATSATVQIRDLQASSQQNDFGLDDISFGSLASVPFSATIASDSPAGSPICSRGTLHLTSTLTGGKAPIKYSWTGPGGFTSTDSNPTISNIAPSAAGTYTLTVTDAYNCPGVVATTVVALNPTPEIPDQSALICSGSSFDATPINGVPTIATFIPNGTKYTWSTPAVSPAGSLTGASAGSALSTISQSLTNTTNTAATATYTVTPVYGTCTGNPFKVVVTVNPTATVNAGINQDICAGSAVQLNGSIGGAATSATWSGGTGTFTPDRNSLTPVYTPSAAEITAGTVTLTLDSNDPDGALGPCSAVTSSITITINSLPTLAFNSVNLNCNGASSGSITLSVTSGTPNYSFGWTASNGGSVPSGQVNAQNLTNLVAGTYNVIVRDSKTCVASKSVILTEPTALVATESHLNVSCAGDASSVIISATGGTAPYSGIGTFSQTVGTTTYTITDANGCTANATAIVTAIPNTAPVITTNPVPRNFNGCTTANISGPVFSSAIANSTYSEFNDTNNKGVATDNCAITTVSYQDVANSGCPISVTRTWTLGDASGLTTTCQQTIKVSDVDKPTWSTAAGALDLTVDCSDVSGKAGALALFPTATDLCDPTVSNVGKPVKTTGAFVPAAGCSQSGTYTNTWKVTDACGNTSDPYIQVITITDNTPPTWTTTEGSLDRTLQCSDNVGLTAAKALKPVASDNCDGSVTNLVKVSGAFVSGGTCGQQGTYTNSWTVKDDCGNLSIAFKQVIAITDNIAPIWITAPGAINTTVECDDVSGLAAAQALRPKAWDNCDANVTDIVKTSGLFVPSGAGSNEGTYTNTWVVKDDCGNTSPIYTQTITVEDNTAPIIYCPPGNAFPCESPSFDPAVTGTATATDHCDPAPDISHTDNIITTSCAGEYKIIRTWTAKDARGNSSSCQQTIFVQDVTPPVLNVPSDRTVDFHNPTTPSSTGTATATDNCDANPFVSYTDQTIAGPTIHDYTIIRTWTAADCANNTSVYAQKITVKDFTALSITCQPAVTANTDLNQSWASNINPGIPTFTGSGVTYSWSMSGVTVGAGNGAMGKRRFNLGITTITWKAKNYSGTTTCTQTVTVLDKQPPTFSVTAASFVQCVEDLNIASYNIATTDINPDRPDYYTFVNGSNLLNLNTATFSDNCSLTKCTVEIRWVIDLKDGTRIPDLSVPYNTGQPSAYGMDIRLPGDGTTFGMSTHTISYWIVDCSGNVSLPKTRTIIIKPRPNLTKKNF